MSFMEIQDVQESTDVGDVWHKAIQQYCVETGQDIKAAGSSHGWSVDAILKEQREEVDKFAKFRHNKGTLDQVRSSINRNTDIILAVAQQVSNAASTSFPPAATILTAFTWVMKAANDVSSDYDMVGSFFDIMGSFLERISLLETKMPAVTAYQNILIRVFSSLLTLCSIATSYGKHGRFSKWAKALVKGNDPKLTGAYGGLNTNIQRLESATMFATLGQTIETQRTLSRVEAITNEGLLVSKQGLAAMEEMSIAVKSGNVLDQDTNTMVRDLQSLVKSMKGREEKVKVDQDDSRAGKAAKSKDAGARRSDALNKVQTAFSSAAKPSIQLKNIQLSFVKGTLKWISDEASWGRFLDGQDTFLWISGDRGMGKSNCAYWATGWLNDHFRHDERTIVAYFFFREEHEELRSVTNLLKAIAVQIATIDGKFREDTAAELRRRSSEGLDTEPSNEDDIWNNFLASKYPKDGEAKLYLVIDGLDEADEKDRNKLIELLEQAKKNNLRIYALITSRPSLDENLKVLEPAILKLTMKLLNNDIKMIINARWKSLSKLKRMKPNLRKKVIRRLKQRADTRLNSIGREALILKELDKLPDSLSELYHSLLLECQKSRTPEEFASLKRLFAWLAYSKRPLTLGEASNLFSLVDTKGTLIIEEEIDGRSARLLRLAQIGADEEQSSEESDNDDSDKDDETIDQAYFDTDSSTHLRFQERSLRQYFREINVDDHGLRSSPSSAHLMIFEMIAKILTSTEGATLHESETAAQLKGYATNFWLRHFLDIEEGNATDEDVKFVIKGLYSIFNNQGRALEKIEEFSEEIGIFGELSTSAIPAIDRWVKRARNFKPEVIGGEEWSWVESISNDPRNLIKGIARKHIENWYTYATNQEESYRSFLFAEYALKMANLLVDESPKITEEYILLVSNTFPDIPKTSSSYRAIGMSMKYADLYEAGLRLCRRAAETATTDKERFDSLNSLAEAAVTLAKSSGKPGDIQSESEMTKDTIEAQAQRDQWAREAREAIEAAVTLCASFNKESNQLQWKLELLNLNVVRAQCQLLAKEFDAAIISIDEARSFFPDDSVDYEVLNDITVALEDNGDYEKLMAFVEKFNRIDRLIWLNDQTDNNKRLQLAASRSKKPDSLVAIYEGVIKHLDHFKYGGVIRQELASYYQYVTGDLDKAKVLIYEIFEKKGLGDVIEESVVLNARSALADILIEQTRNTSDPEEKARLLDEMKALAYRNSAILATDFNADASQTAVTTALMLRKMGPLQEFQSVLNKSFNSCIEALSDAYGWNDNITFRLLARVLACIPGLERDAQIALVCQFYIVDPKFKQQPNSDAGVDLRGTEAGEKPAATHDSTEENPPPYTEFPEEKAVPITQAAKEEANNEKVEDNSDEDLDPAWAVFCNGCNKHFRHLHDAVAYNCIICTEVDLCSDCYAKRISWNNGEPNKDWRSFCGKNHHYIKQPPEGWKGVKDGVISLGDEKLEFKEWLRNLQERWEEAWKKFWVSESVEDIL